MTLNELVLDKLKEENSKHYLIARQYLKYAKPKLKRRYK